MATQVQNRRGSTAEHSTFTGAVGEVTIDTDKDTAVVHDGSTAGGRPLLREDLSNLPAGTIDNADINASAAIAGTKISPDFGSQNVVTTGTSTAASFIPTSSTAPTNGLYLSAANSVALSTNGTGRVFINNTGLGIGGLPSHPAQIYSTGTGTYFKLTASDAIANGDRTITIAADRPGVAYHNLAFSASEYQFGVSGAERLRITSTGQLSHIGAGSSGSPAVSFSGSAASNSLVVDSSSRVGIGTSAPISQLDIVGVGVPFGLLRVSNGTQTGWFGATSTTSGFWGGGVNTVPALAIGTSSNHPITFGTNNIGRVILDTSGRVGIGTSAPSTTLHCATNNSSTSVGTSTLTAILQNSNATSGAINGLGFANSGGFYSAAIYTTQAQTGNSGDNLVLNTKTSGGAWNTGVVIDTAGRVGIGTSSPLCLIDGRGGADGNVMLLRGGSTRQLTFGTTSTNPFINADNGAGLEFQVNGSARAVLDTSGRLLVGTSSTSADVRVLIQSTTSNPSEAGRLYIARGDSSPVSGGGLGYVAFTDSGHGIAAYLGAERDGGTWNTSTSRPTRLVFSTTSDGQASPTPRLTITSTGQVRLAGAGITFNGDTATANELDDYEEGTWTPAASVGTLTSNATATYTKIGRTVTVFFDVTMPVQTDGNSARLDGLPFNPGSSGVGVALGYTTYGTAVTMGTGFLAGSSFSFRDVSGNLLTLTNVSGKRFAGACTYFV